MVLATKQQLCVLFLLVLVWFRVLAAHDSTDAADSCPKGFFCPVTAPDKNLTVPCGYSATQYCPEHSHQPLPTAQGFFATGFVRPQVTPSSPGSNTLQVGGFTAQVKCPRGSYCIDGVKKLCPAGRYGGSTGNTNASCSGLCTAGFFCPEGSTVSTQKPCGVDATVFCPTGSAAPTRVLRSYYSNGHGPGMILDIQEVRLSNVNRTTTKFCLALSGTSTKYATCPANAALLKISSTASAIQDYLQNLQDNLVTVTPPILVGSTFTFTVTFSGYVRHVDMLVAQKASSASASVISEVFRISEATEPLVGEKYLGLRHTAQTLCEPGYWCDEKTGIRRKCPAGRYGDAAGLFNAECSGLCAAGYYCAEGSVAPSRFKCGAVNVFCPTGSSVPTAVSDGYYTTNGEEGTESDELTRSSERKCEPGSWCSAGIRRLCIPGFWGGTFGAQYKTCSGSCNEGYLCPEGSTKPNEVMCGDPNYFCPAKSSMPVKVSPGYYSTGGTEATRTGQAIAPKGSYASAGLLFPCRAGFFGASEGMSTALCSGQCAAGFYCPIGSTSPVMRVCGGDDVYCVPSSVAPIHVEPGFYTADYLYDVCPPGKFRKAESLWIDASYHGSSLLTTATQKPECSICPSGKFKVVEGDSDALCKPCGGDEFNNTNVVTFNYTSSVDRTTCICNSAQTDDGYFFYFNASSASCTKLLASSIALFPDDAWQYNVSLTRSVQKECEPGHYCVKGLRFRCPLGFYGALTRETRPQCQGLCSQGYYCREASISPFATPCGAVDAICPTGSSLPVKVPAGFYTLDGAQETLRFASAICPLGSYCPGDGRKYLCPEGTYADVEGETSSQCSGLCDRGYYCTGGSSSKQQYKCGSANVFCPIGSAHPIPVHEGFYSIFTGVDAGAQKLWDQQNSTASAELPCEPGYYCVKGIKSPCPPGTFGWQFGDTTPQCGGFCSAGYYCPSYLTPQVGAPSQTVWPGKPHTSAAELECGGVTFYCPRGAIFPLYVGAGNYTVGGTDKLNNTRTGQHPCRPGTFCQNGIVNLCPKGRYGDKVGESVPTCTGWCPPGHYCPPGTSAPLPCTGASYSVGSSWACSPCPGETRTLPCNDNRGCCFRSVNIG